MHVFITLRNILFAKDGLQGIGPEKFSSLFNISGQQHRHNTRRTTINKCLVTERTNTERYGTNSIKSKCIKNWNNMQRTLDVGILDSSRSLVKIKSYTYCIHIRKLELFRQEGTLLIEEASLNYNGFLLCIFFEHEKQTKQEQSIDYLVYYQIILNVCS